MSTVSRCSETYCRVKISPQIAGVLDANIDSNGFEGDSSQRH
jgi:hypothetical protein